jgi:hypothetical protein
MRLFVLHSAHSISTTLPLTHVLMALALVSSSMSISLAPNAMRYDTGTQDSGAVQNDESCQVCIVAFFVQVAQQQVGGAPPADVDGS